MCKVYLELFLTRCSALVCCKTRLASFGAQWFSVFGSQGAGTDDQVLIEILASRSGEEIKETTKVYKKGDELKNGIIEAKVCPNEFS